MKPSIAIRRAPKLTLAHLHYGTSLLAKGGIEGAVDAFNTAIKLEPDYAEEHCNLGLALQKSGQVDSAIASYHRALEIRPDHAEAYSNLDLALQSIGQLDGAMANYQRALEIKPDLHQARYSTRRVLPGISRTRGGGCGKFIRLDRGALHDPAIESEKWRESWRLGLKHTVQRGVVCLRRYFLPLSSSISRSSRKSLSMTDS